MDMRKNEKGSSLIFAVVVIMVIAITIAAALAISFSYYNRSIAANTERQAYLTAKSVLTNIVDNIDAENKEYLDLIPDGTTSSSKTLEVKDFPSEMGTIDSVSLSLSQRTDDNIEKEILTISVKATYSTHTKIMNADFKRTKGKKAWNFEKYYEGEVSTLNINVVNAIQTLKLPNSLIEEYSKEPKWASKTLENALKNNVNAWSIMEQRKWEYKSSNDSLREYIYYGINGGDWISFDEVNVFDNLSSDVIKNIKGLTIQPYFTSDLLICVIYASSSTKVSGGGWQDVRLIYHVTEQEWYYLKKSISITEFSNYKSPNEEYAPPNTVFLSSIEYYNYFINNYLTDTNKAIKIT